MVISQILHISEILALPAERVQDGTIKLMRITIDIRLLARGGTTGIPGYTRDLIDALITDSADNHYTLYYTGLRREPLPEHWRNNPKVSIATETIPNRLLDLSFRLSDALKFAPAKPVGNPDLVFSPHFNLLPKLTVPRVITFHDLSFLHYPQFFSGQQRLWHRLQNYHKQAKEAEHIIAVSEFTKADLINLLGIPSEKITVIYSGINPSFKKLAASDPQLTNYQLTNKLTNPFFLYLGSIEPRKNLQLLVRAFSELKSDDKFKDYELVLAGKAGFQSGEIFKLIDDSSASSDIRVLGAVADSDRVYLYNLARAFVFPSWFEGFGFPPIEAQACGTPVIASGRTSLPEILADSALYIDPWNVSRLAEQMKTIENDESLRSRIISSGMANSERFNWQSTALQTLKVFGKYAK